MNKKTLIVFIVLIVVIAGAAGYFSYLLGHKIGYDEGKEVGRAAAQIKAGAAVTNPLESMPSTNPFEEVVNPFGELYTNPFE